MSKPIGMSGLSRIADDKKARHIVFPLDTSVQQMIGLDPEKTYAVFASGAGPATLTVAATTDSKEAVSKGTAKWAANKVYTAIAAAGGYIGPVGPGATAMRVTHIKSGAGVDDAPTVALMGGRYEVRVVEDSDGTTGLGDFTAVAAD